MASVCISFRLETWRVLATTDITNRAFRTKAELNNATRPRAQMTGCKRTRLDQMLFQLLLNRAREAARTLQQAGSCATTHETAAKCAGAEFRIHAKSCNGVQACPLFLVHRRVLGVLGNTFRALAICTVSIPLELSKQTIRRKSEFIAWPRLIRQPSPGSQSLPPALCMVLCAGHEP